MDELPITPVELVAIDAARNIRRGWRIAAHRDLFGQVMIETGWGRIGGRGRILVRSFSTETDALRYVNALLARRGRAVRRIGVDYRPTASARHDPVRQAPLPGGGASSVRAPAIPDTPSVGRRAALPGCVALRTGTPAHEPL